MAEFIRGFFRAVHESNWFIHSFFVSENKKATRRLLPFLKDGRDDRIRTCDLIVPNDALYQAEPHPDMDSIVAMFLIFVKQYAPAACVYRIVQLFPVPCGQRLHGVP